MPSFTVKTTNRTLILGYKNQQIMLNTSQVKYLPDITLERCIFYKFNSFSSNDTDTLGSHLCRDALWEALPR